MKITMRLLGCVAVCAFAAGQAHAQLAKPVRLIVSDGGNLTLARQFLFELKEQVRRSSGLFLTDSYDSVSASFLFMDVQETSLKGATVVVSYAVANGTTTIKGSPTFENFGLLSCGDQKLADCARIVLAALDDVDVQTSFLRRKN